MILKLKLVAMLFLAGVFSCQRQIFYRFLILPGVGLLVFISTANATLFSWDGSSATVTSGSDANITVADLTRVNAGGNLTGSSSPASPGSGGSYFMAAAQAGALSTSSSTYFQIILTPTAGNEIRLNSISLYSRSTSTGPALISIFSSMDNYAAAFGSATVANDSNWSSLLSFNGNSTTTSALNSPVTFRIYASGGSSSSGGNWRVDDIGLNVTAVPEPASMGLICAVGLLALGGWNFWRERRAAGFAAATNA
jgi:hypothetical protein